MILKHNTDGATNGSLGLAGGVGDFRNCWGFFQGCFMIPLGLMTAFKAELLTSIFGLERARHVGWDHIWLKCDSTYVVHLFTFRSHKVLWKFRAPWLACLWFISSL